MQWSGDAEEMGSWRERNLSATLKPLDARVWRQGDLSSVESWQYGPK